MDTLLALLVGVVAATAVYLMLSRDGFRLLLGMMLLTTAANLGVVVAGRPGGERPPFVPEGAQAVPVELVSNPLPQAFVLTAIVIGFGVFAFIIALLLRILAVFDTLDVDSLGAAEPAANARGEERTS